MPKVLIIAGPNGVGKTTFARQFLPYEARTFEFVNADLIAAGISPFNPGSADISAGRVMLERLADLAQIGNDFALETTLSGTWLRKCILDWKKQGYMVELHYLKLSTVEIALERIRMRVLKGGHNIPEEVARRRFGKSLQLLEDVYKNLSSDWYVYDSDGAVPILIDLGVNKR